MNQFFRVAGLALAVSVPSIATAATLTNLDNEAHTLTVTEGSTQNEVSIAAGETIEICANGCFLTLPNGDREVLAGPEKLEIQGGRARIL
jgi:hypothetical protein